MTRFVSGGQGAARFLSIDVLEQRTLLSAVVNLPWNGAATKAFSGHFVLQMDGFAGDASAQMTTMNGMLGGATARYHATSHLGTNGLFLLESFKQESKSQLKIHQAKVLLGKLKGFRYVEPDFQVQASAIPNDPRFIEQWGLNNTAQFVGATPDADIDAPEAWDITTGSRSIVAGIIDSGIDYNHPDLAANMWINPGEIAGNGIDDDGNGFIDDVRGWDFANNDNDPFDDNEHGTHVAGTVGAVGNNGVGVTGVAWQAQLMALKFLDATGSGSTAAATSAINYATMMRNRGINIRVTNNSWGGGGGSSALLDAIQKNRDAGMLFVAAAGNNASNNDTTPNYPSGYAVDNIISVAATTFNDTLASFSNYGATTVDLGAPGESILSTTPNNTYNYLSGTSMATPHVTGVAVLGFSLKPDGTYAQVRDAILSSVDQVPALAGVTVTGGRLNAFKTLQQLQSTPVITSPVAPTNLTATALSRTSVKLSFVDQASNEDGFVVQRSVDQKNWSEIATLPAASGTGSTVSYTDNNLARRTTYYYRVRAFNAAGSSGYSNVAGATTLR